MSKHLQPRRTTADYLLFMVIGLIGAVVLVGLVRDNINTETIGVLAGLAGTLAAFLKKGTGDKGGDAQ